MLDVCDTWVYNGRIKFRYKRSVMKQTAMMGVGVHASDEEVIVAVHLKQGEHTTVMYMQKHPQNCDSLGTVALENNISNTGMLQFLTDVVTAAGLLSHGKTDKALAKRISDRAYEIRTAMFAEAYTQKEQ